MIKNKILAMVLIGCTLTMAKPTPSHAVLGVIVGTAGGAELVYGLTFAGLGIACLGAALNEPTPKDKWLDIIGGIIFLDSKEGNATPKFIAPNSQVIAEAHLRPNEVRNYNSEIPRLDENAAQVLAEASRLKQEGNDNRKIAQISYDRATELSQETLSPEALSAFTKIRALIQARAESAAAALH
jgi:hypothetical protein